MEIQTDNVVNIYINLCIVLNIPREQNLLNVLNIPEFDFGLINTTCPKAFSILNALHSSSVRISGLMTTGCSVTFLLDQIRIRSWHWNVRTNMKTIVMEIVCVVPKFPYRSSRFIHPSFCVALAHSQIPSRDSTFPFMSGEAC